MTKHLTQSTYTHLHITYTKQASQTTSKTAKHTPHSETKHNHNANSKNCVPQGCVLSPKVFDSNNTGTSKTHDIHKHPIIPRRNTYMCTLFTPDPAEYSTQLELQIDNIALDPHDHQTKILKLTLDPKLTYNNNSRQGNTTTQITYINNMGKQKETIFVTYKAITRPIIECVSTIWSCCLPTPMTLASEG